MYENVRVDNVCNCQEIINFLLITAPDSETLLHISAVSDLMVRGRYFCYLFVIFCK